MLFLAQIIQVMPTDNITYQNSGYFSALINDYLDQKLELRSLYHRFPILENFEEQIAEKNINFNGNGNFIDSEKRKILVSALQDQYSGIKMSFQTLQNIDSLAHENTFTVTTGHQLNLFGGPLYFLYKIISTINLAKELKSKYPDYNFVPVYWMATEDHDFAEINYFNFRNEKIAWNKNSSGPVGRLLTEGLDTVFEDFASKLGVGNNAAILKKWFEDAYLKHSNLADATRFLTNEWFGDQGLVIIDGDDRELKQIFAPFVKDELLKQSSFREVSKTNDSLSNYGIQVNPREINLFYIEDDLRERIVLENGIYKVNNTAISFTQDEILKELENHPEKFSPNVIMRPLYQEVILPNLCYIGGGGEIAYWLQLKSFFESQNIAFPMLLVRNSVLLASEKQTQKADKLNLHWKDLFAKQTELINRKTEELSDFPIDLSDLKMQLKNQFESLNDISAQTDPSFLGAVKAQETKQIKGLENLEKRLLKAQKKKLAEKLQRIADLQNELFPKQSLQERYNNFSEFYLENGDLLFEKLFSELKPLEQEFKILVF